MAWDFWHFLYSEDDRLVRTCGLRNGMVPAYDKLQKHPAVLSDPFANVVASGLDNGIIIAEMPNVWAQTVDQFVFDEVIIGGKEIRSALQEG